MPQEEPVSLEYELRRENEWWGFVRAALIGWSAIGLFRFLVALDGFDFRHGAPLLIPGLLDFAGCAAILFGSLTTFSLTPTNTALTIGGAALVLHAAMATWLGFERRDSHLPSLLASVQHVWFPVALVLLRIKTTQVLPETGWMGRLGSPIHLLLASQVPGVLGMCLMCALMVGLIDRFYATFMVTLAMTVGASFLSAALSMPFFSTPHHRLALRLVVGHAIYIVCLVVT